MENVDEVVENQLDNFRVNLHIFKGKFHAITPVLYLAGDNYCHFSGSQRELRIQEYL